MTCPLGHWAFAASGTCQMGKAKATHPEEIKANRSYANITYFVYKCQSWSVLASEKYREKPKDTRAIRKIWGDSPVPISATDGTLVTQLGIAGL